MTKTIDYKRYICALFSAIFSTLGLMCPIITAVISTIFLHKVEDMRAFDDLDYEEDKDTETLYIVGKIMTTVNIIWGILIITAIIGLILVNHGVADEIMRKVMH